MKFQKSKPPNTFFPKRIRYKLKPQKKNPLKEEKDRNSN